MLNNITLDETFCSVERLSNVVKAAGLEQLVEDKHQASVKILHENGKNISGGQRQRIAIARALYKKADLIILDEPFSELDKISERQLLNFFKGLASSGKMIILVTHSKESLSFCDTIISLDEK